MNEHTDKHAAGPPPDPELEARRRVLARISIALGAVGAALMGIPLVGFIVAPLFRKAHRQWRKVGDKDQFKQGETVNVTLIDASPLPWAGVTSKAGAWLRREDGDKFVAFSVHCAHLGCPVRWLPDANLFMCPCHGGVYYADGSVAAGPPPHGLTQYPCRVAPDGSVEIHTEPIPIG